MRKILMIATIMMAYGVAYGDIASTDYVDDGAHHKQGALTTGSGVIIIDDVISTTQTTSPEIGNNTTSGIIKLYSDIGSGVDGGITQNALTTALNNKQDILPHAPTNGKYDVVWDGSTGGFRLELQRFSLICPSGLYDLGFDQCVNSSFLDINGTKSTYSAAKHSWTVEFTYGTIEGISTCTNTYASAIADIKPGNTFTQGSTGVYCWCQMTQPSTSSWVFMTNYGFNTSCANNCASGCAGQVYGRSSFRSAMFPSVGQ